MSSTPESDLVMRSLALYLQSELNYAYAQLSGTADKVVAHVLDYNDFATEANQFPLLTAYRTGSQGQDLRRSAAVVAYYLHSMAVQQRLPGILRWVELQIANALEHYAGHVEGCVLSLGNLRSEYRIGLLGDARPFPFLKISFELEE